MLLDKSEIHFGKKISTVIIEGNEEGCTGKGDTASLMDTADPHEPLFSIEEEDSHPAIGYERRTSAYGYGRKTLEQSRLNDEKIHYYSNWVIARSVIISKALGMAQDRDSANAVNPSMAGRFFEGRYLPEESIARAGKFLFVLSGEDWRNIDKASPLVPSKICWPNLVLLIFTFAGIEGDYMNGCRETPLSLSSFRSFGHIDDFGFNIDSDQQIEGFKVFGLIASFSVLSRLLIGQVYSDDYSDSAVLISACGWSIFFDSVDAVDPSNVSTDCMRVIRGVPSRNGLRKARIIDGPTDTGPSTRPRSFIKMTKAKRQWAEVATAKRDRILVRQTSDAFQITQMFKWSPGRLSDGFSIIKLGFREMQEICIAARKTPACECERSQTGLKSLSEELEEDMVMCMGSRCLGLTLATGETEDAQRSGTQPDGPNISVIGCRLEGEL